MQSCDSEALFLTQCRNFAAFSWLAFIAGDFTQADKDPVIQIANVVKVQGSDDVVAKNVFTLGGCTPIVGAHVITNDTEDELLWEVGRFRLLLPLEGPLVMYSYLLNFKTTSDPLSCFF